MDWQIIRLTGEWGELLAAIKPAWGHASKVTHDNCSGPVI